MTVRVWVTCTSQAALWDPLDVLRCGDFTPFDFCHVSLSKIKQLEEEEEKEKEKEKREE